MSIDFMVFDPRSAPREHNAFRAWYREQTSWDGDDYYDPAITTPSIRSWYQQMTAHFPDSNAVGIDPEEIDETFGDYNFGESICYVAFKSSIADEAWALTRLLAAQHRLGTYDPNSDDERSGTAISFPDLAGSD